VALLGAAEAEQLLATHDWKALPAIDAFYAAEKEDEEADDAGGRGGGQVLVAREEQGFQIGAGAGGRQLLAGEVSADSETFGQSNSEFDPDIGSGQDLHDLRRGLDTVRALFPVCTIYPILPLRQRRHQKPFRSPCEHTYYI
jgi:hypothetical protein